MKIIVTAIPADLITSLLTSKKQESGFKQVGGKLFRASRALLQSHSEFNKIL